MDTQKALTFGTIPSLEKELLLAHVLHVPRTKLLAHPDQELTAIQEGEYLKLLDRREKHEPLAYIINEKEFYGRSFFVDERVLVPRPATEGLIDATLNLLKTGEETIDETDSQIVAGVKLFQEWQKPELIVDIGTGSGCIAVTLALENPELRIIATDESNAALAVAQINITKYHTEDRVSLLQGDLLEPLKNITEPFLIVSNPPYVPAGDVLEPDVKDYEPHAALFAGDDGMNVLRKLWSQANAHPHCIGVVLECREDQWQALLKL